MPSQTEAALRNCNAFNVTIAHRPVNGSLLGAVGVALSTLIDPALVTEMLALKTGEHICLIYRDDQVEKLGALLPFISQGLRAGEQCIYSADDQTVDELRDSLKHYGIDTPAHEASGALQLWTRDEWRQPGELNSVLKAEQVRGFIDRALRDGYT